MVDKIWRILRELLPIRLRVGISSRSLFQPLSRSSYTPIVRKSCSSHRLLSLRSFSFSQMWHGWALIAGICNCANICKSSYISDYRSSLICEKSDQLIRHLIDIRESFGAMSISCAHLKLQTTNCVCDLIICTSGLSLVVEEFRSVEVTTDIYTYIRMLILISMTARGLAYILYR